MSERTYAFRDRADEKSAADLESEAERAKALIDGLHYRVFNTPDGKELLAYLRAITIERRNPQMDSDGALREAEANRNFVANIERRIARHTTAKPKAKSG